MTSTYIYLRKKKKHGQEFTRFLLKGGVEDFVSNMDKEYPESYLYLMMNENVDVLFNDPSPKAVWPLDHDFKDDSRLKSWLKEE